MLSGMGTGPLKLPPTHPLYDWAQERKGSDWRQETALARHRLEIAARKRRRKAQREAEADAAWAAYREERGQA